METLFEHIAQDGHEETVKEGFFTRTFRTAAALMGWAIASHVPENKATVMDEMIRSRDERHR